MNGCRRMGEGTVRAVGERGTTCVLVIRSEMKTVASDERICVNGCRRMGGGRVRLAGESCTVCVQVGMGVSEMHQ